MSGSATSGARPRPGDELEVRRLRLAYGGEAVGRTETGFVAFVDRGAPDEDVRARVRRVHRRHVETEIVELLRPSAARIAPRCPHFAQGCGGCTWQHVDYEAQLAAKSEIVRDSLERLGGLRDLPLSPIIAADSAWYYRNKMDFAFHPDGGLGLHLRGQWDAIFSLETCYLQSPLSVALVHEARAFAAERRLALYHPRAREGFLRQLVIRHSRGGREVMVGVVTSPGPFPEAADLAARLAALDASMVSVVRGIRSGPSDGSPLERTEVLHGRPHITEEVAGLSFRIGLESFFQTNTAQAERMVQVVRAMAGDVAGGLVVDVFCGVGLFSLALARDAASVAGVEIVAPAIAAARENAAGNGIQNAHFYAGDARTTLPQVLATHGVPRVVVLDPPRGGAGGKVMRRIARAAPERIVYVSCNPTTLARDLQELRPFGYQVTAVQPIDLFPQTYHVEVVASLERR